VLVPTRRRANDVLFTFIGVVYFWFCVLFLRHKREFCERRPRASSQCVWRPQEISKRLSTFVCKMKI
jgi:hypothetical protein